MYIPMLLARWRTIGIVMQLRPDGCQLIEVIPDWIVSDFVYAPRLLRNIAAKVELVALLSG